MPFLSSNAQVVLLMFAAAAAGTVALMWSISLAAGVRRPMLAKAGAAAALALPLFYAATFLVLSAAREERALRHHRPGQSCEVDWRASYSVERVTRGN